MSSSKSGYSQSQGLQLLESAVEEYGPIFTLAQLQPLASRQQLSAPHLRLIISSLARAGWIEILKRGVYVVKSPLYAGEISPFAIASALIQPIAISHWSACSIHGFTTQSPTMIQASTPAMVITPEMRRGKAHSPRGRAIWRLSGLEFEFIHVRKSAFWGFEKHWVNSTQQINLTDRERTALDLIARPDIFGGLAPAIEILEDALPQIQPDRLVAYALRLGVGSVIKRLGWALEKLGLSPTTLEPLRALPRQALLPPGSPSPASGSQGSPLAYLRKFTPLILCPPSARSSKQPSVKPVSARRVVRQDIVEKDYALSYLLAAIAQVPELSRNLVLKGGTALRKFYFPGYRFSEDLDFSTRLLGSTTTA